MGSQTPSKSAFWDLMQFSQFPSAAPSCFLNLIDCLKSLPFQRWFQLWKKPEGTGCRILAVEGLRIESHGWFDVLPKHFVRDVMHEWAHCHDKAANEQLPIAVAFWIVPMISMEECSSLMQHLIQISCSSRSVILNVVATKYFSWLSGIYRPHQLVQ